MAGIISLAKCGYVLPVQSLEACIKISLIIFVIEYKTKSKN